MRVVKKGNNGSGMSCREVERALATSNAPGPEGLPPAVRAHIQVCRSCQAFASRVDLPTAQVEMDANQIEHLQKMIIADLRPVRRLLPSWVFLGAFAVVFLALSSAGWLYLGPYNWFLLMPGQKIAVFSTLAASAALLAFSLVRQMVPGQKSLLHPGLLPIAIFVFLCLVVASVFQVRADHNFLRSGEACLKAGLPYAIPAALLFWLILRRGAILSPRIAGATTGMLAGFVSTTVLEVHCPNRDVWHILVWHVGFALLGIIAGLLIAIAGEAIRKRKS
jgi:hypothetical protein